MLDDPRLQPVMDALKDGLLDHAHGELDYDEERQVEFLYCESAEFGINLYQLALDVLRSVDGVRVS